MPAKYLIMLLMLSLRTNKDIVSVVEFEALRTATHLHKLNTIRWISILKFSRQLHCGTEAIRRHTNLPTNILRISSINTSIQT